MAEGREAAARRDTETADRLRRFADAKAAAEAAAYRRAEADAKSRVVEAEAARNVAAAAARRAAAEAESARRAGAASAAASAAADEPVQSRPQDCLPPGWAAHTTDDGSVFYSDGETSTWERPTAETTHAAQLAAAQAGLPPGWTARMTDDGSIYYSDVTSSTWDRPSAAVIKVAKPLPSRLTVLTPLAARPAAAVLAESTDPPSCDPDSGTLLPSPTAAFSWSLPAAQVKAMLCLFEQLDKDGSGNLDKAEARALLKEVAYKKAYMLREAELWRVADRDGDGKLSPVEFLILAHAAAWLSSVPKGAPLPIPMSADFAVVEASIVYYNMTGSSDADGNTTLHYLAGEGDGAGIRELLDEYVNPNVANAVGERPLHVAAACGAMEVVHALLSSGAAVNALDGGGRTPLDAALVSAAEGTAGVQAALKAAGGAAMFSVAERQRVREREAAAAAAAREAAARVAAAALEAERVAAARAPLLGMGAVGRKLYDTLSSTYPVVQAGRWQLEPWLRGDAHASGCSA